MGVNTQLVQMYYVFYSITNLFYGPTEIQVQKIYFPLVLEYLIYTDDFCFYIFFRCLSLNQYFFIII